MKKRAFTLAETLITLGIIGIVAAMTVPVLISNTNGAKYRSQLKKTYSTLNQAGLLAQAQYEYNYAGTSVLCPESQTEGAKHNPETEMSFCSIFNGTLQGATYVGKVSSLKRVEKNVETTYSLATKETLPDNYGDFLAYLLPNGAIIAFHPEARGCELPIGRRLVQDIFTGTVDGVSLKNCVGFIDVNGVSLPNREVRCASGVNKVDAGSNCIVDNNANRLLDVYPIVFHDATVEPASGAAQFVLDTQKI
ncbi:MAG: type II secretion system GspH family protein [Muribaculaceae bacterium]|nr:type II secretion system GspH family protein [Muribaculaceae bacterium]